MTTSTSTASRWRSRGIGGQRRPAHARLEAPPLYADTMNARGLDGFHCTEFFVPNLHVLHSDYGEGKPRGSRAT